ISAVEMGCPGGAPRLADTGGRVEYEKRRSLQGEFAKKPSSALTYFLPFSTFYFLSRILRLLPFPAMLPRPVRSHLRQTIHVHGGALALFFARHRFDQVDCLGEVLFD